MDLIQIISKKASRIRSFRKCYSRPPWLTNAAVTSPVALGFSKHSCNCDHPGSSVDTFAQQVIRLDTRDVEVMDGSASFSLSRNYSGGAEWVSPIVDIERAFLALLRISHCYFADTKQQGLSM
jgi:hypothetical protein